jgi:DNA topoisomerase-3
LKQKTLIITEKPSVALDFAKGLGVNLSKKTKGYIEDDRYIITWAIGHLVELYEPKDYNVSWDKPWRLEVLPMIPKQYKDKPIKNVKDQFDIVMKLLARKDISSVVGATDAGREGEVIFRTILYRSAYKGPFYRFWSSQALTPQVIREEMKNLRPGSDYDRLWAAGRARQVSDWLIGMNATRALSVKMGEFYSVGRVQTACVALLVDRLRERENFVPEPYWVLEATFENAKGTWVGHWFDKNVEKFTDENAADAVLKKIQGQTGVVESVKKEKKQQAPPPLYSLTELQRDANTRYGFSAQHTLDLAQNLYQTHKALSYPRTDSHVMGEKNVGKVAGLIKELSAVYPTLFAGVDMSLVSVKNKRVFDDSKLTDHPALTPERPVPDEASADEKKLYQLVIERFAAAFYPPCKYESTEVVTDVRGEKFVSRGRVILEQGWREVYSGAQNQQDIILPPVTKGDPAQVVKAENVKKMTVPPPHYTEASLLKDMANPAKFVDEDQYKDVFRGNACGLGTQATRAGIIETILQRNYAVRDKKLIIATPKGCTLIDNMRILPVAGTLTSPTETARWEMILERIAKGEKITKKFMEGIERFITRIIEEIKGMQSVSISRSGEGKGDKGGPGKVIGKCPHCGGNVVVDAKGYVCECGFIIWRRISGTKILESVAKTLIQGKTTDPIRFISKKTQLPFSARLKVEEDKVVFVFDHGNNGGNGNGAGNMNNEVVGVCPSCGGEILENHRGYGCINWKKGCKFFIWKTLAGTQITKDIAQELLEGAETETLNFTSKKGKPFSARLALVEEDDTWKTAFIYNT